MSRSRRGEKDTTALRFDERRRLGSTFSRDDAALRSTHVGEVAILFLGAKREKKISRATSFRSLSRVEHNDKRILRGTWVGRR